MGISDSTSEAIAGTGRAVVRTLRARVAIVGPAERPGGELGLCTNKSVFLLDTEPGFFIGGIENFLGMNTEVGVGRLKLLAGSVSPSVSVAHDEDMVSAAEGISEDSDRAHDDLRVVSGGLVA